MNTLTQEQEAVINQFLQTAKTCGADNVHSPFNACCYRDQCRANAEALASQPAPSADRMAIKMLVAAGFVTEAKANEALQIAHGFERGPLEPAPSAAQGAVGMCPGCDCEAPWECPRQQPASVEVPEGWSLQAVGDADIFVLTTPEGLEWIVEPHERLHVLCSALAAAKQENSHE